MVTIQVSGDVGSFKHYEITVQDVTAKLANEQLEQALVAVIKALQGRKDA